MKKLTELFDSLMTGEPAEELLDLIPEYVEAQKENSKLKYRKNILQKVFSRLRIFQLVIF